MKSMSYDRVPSSQKQDIRAAVKKALDQHLKEALEKQEGIAPARRVLDAIISREGILANDLDALAENLQTGSDIEVVHEVFISGMMDGFRIILDKNSTIGDADLELLDNLSRFPKLRSGYLQVMLMPIEEVVRELSQTLTGSLIGYVAGVTDRTVRSWTSGRHSLRRGSAVRLRALLTAVRILREAENPKVVLRWFANTNPDLNDSAPAEVLKKGEKLDWVIRSSAAYAEDGA